MPVDQNGRPIYPDEGWSTGNVRRVGDPEGLITRGNLDLTNRPVVKQNGKMATLRPISIEQDGRHVLIPTVIGDRVVGTNEAIASYKQTGLHLGVFSTQEHADAYAQELSKTQDERYQSGRAREDFLPEAPRSTRIEDRRKGQERMPQGQRGIW